MGLTGAWLSLDPVIDRLGATVAKGLRVAELAGRVGPHYPQVEQIQRAPSGSGIAKGYGVDQLANCLDRWNIKRYARDREMDALFVLRTASGFDEIATGAFDA